MDDSKKKKAFGIFAKDYKKYRGEPDKKLYRHLFSLIPKRKGTDRISILDIGCGVGNSTEPLLKIKNVSVTGCDIDERMLREARSSAKKNRLPITYVQAPAEKLPFQKESFDIAISGAAFHWFANAKAMKEIQSVLKKDGVYLVFWHFNKTSNDKRVGIDVYRKYKWSGIPKELLKVNNIKDVLKENGFKNVKSIKIPVTEKRNVPDTIGLIKTNSMYALLSPAQQKDFTEGMTKAYKEAFKNNDQVVLTEDICVCWGYKS